MRKVIFLVVMIGGMVAINLMAQTSSTGCLRGRILDSTTLEGIPFANVFTYQNNGQQYGDQTDMDGNYNIGNLDTGKHEIYVSYIGYKPKKPTEVFIIPYKIILKDIYLITDFDSIKKINVTHCPIPVIEIKPDSLKK